MWVLYQDYAWCENPFGSSLYSSKGFRLVRRQQIVDNAQQQFCSNNKAALLLLRYKTRASEVTENMTMYQAL